MSVILKQGAASEDMVWYALDRSFGGKRTEALRIDALTGLVKINGVALVGGSIAATTTIAANSSLVYAAGTGGLDAHLATGAFRLGGTTSTLAFFGVAAVSKPSAYTLTYSTAAKTVPNATSHAITDSSGGTPSTTAIAAITQVGTAGSADIAPTQNAIATLAAELALTKADLLALKKVVVALVVDAQALGLVG